MKKSFKSSAKNEKSATSRPKISRGSTAMEWVSGLRTRSTPSTDSETTRPELYEPDGWNSSATVAQPDVFFTTNEPQPPAGHEFRRLRRVRAASLKKYSQITLCKVEWRAQRTNCWPLKLIPDLAKSLRCSESPEVPSNLWTGFKAEFWKDPPSNLKFCEL